jgi:hypothetical protein
VEVVTPQKQLMQNLLKKLKLYQRAIDMNKIKSFIAIGFVFVFLTGLSGSSDYEKFMPSVNDVDPVVFALTQPNMFVCILSKINPHKNVGKGSYLSKVNMDYCLNGREGSSDLWADIYAKVTTNPNNNTGYIADIWLNTPMGNREAFGRFIINSAPSDKLINGNLTFSLCLVNSALGSECSTKSFGKINDNLLEVYFLEKDIADGTLGQLGIIKANVSKQSGYGAFHKIYKFEDQGLIAMEFKGQYSFSNNETLVNFDVSDNPTGWGGLDFILGTTCNSNKLSENSKKLYEYNLYDQNGAYLTKIDGSVNPNLPAVKFEYQNLDYIWTDLLKGSSSTSVNFFNSIDKAQITSNGDSYYVRPSVYDSVSKILTLNECVSLTLTQTSQYKNDIQTIFDSVTTNNIVSFNSFGTINSSWEDPKATIGARPILSNSTYKYVHGKTP